MRFPYIRVCAYWFPETSNGWFTDDMVTEEKGRRWVMKMSNNLPVDGCPEIGLFRKFRTGRFVILSSPGERHRPIFRPPMKFVSQFFTNNIKHLPRTQITRVQRRVLWIVTTNQEKKYRANIKLMRDNIKLNKTKCTDSNYKSYFS